MNCQTNQTIEPCHGKTNRGFKCKTSLELWSYEELESVTVHEFEYQSEQYIEFGCYETKCEVWAAFSEPTDPCKWYFGPDCLPSYQDKARAMMTCYGSEKFVEAEFFANYKPELKDRAILAANRLDLLTLSKEDERELEEELSRVYNELFWTIDYIMQKTAADPACACVEYCRDLEYLLEQYQERELEYFEAIGRLEKHDPYTIGLYV